MRLASAADARARGGPITPDEALQLQYADMLIDVSMNRNSDQCIVMEKIDFDMSVLSLPFMNYHTEVEEAVEWLYPGMQLDFSATILCSNNNSVDMWNSIAQKMNTEQERILHSKDSFSEVDDPKGHLMKML
jgi:hypothetical protein